MNRNKLKLQKGYRQENGLSVINPDFSAGIPKMKFLLTAKLRTFSSPQLSYLAQFVP